MRIGIDCRKIADFGIGRYVRGLLSGLATLDGDETFVLFGPESIRPLVPRSQRFELIELDAPHYSLVELIVVGRAISAAGLDLFHAPHYVVPFTSTPVIVTIHDLIHLHSKHPSPLARPYALWMIGRATRIARAILTPTAAVRDEIAARYPRAAGKILVTPNGVDPIFFEAAEGGQGPDARAAGGYFLYVGNDKPHKNLDRFVSAFRSVRGERPDLSLVVAGVEPARFRGIDGVELAGHVPDSELAVLYRGALALVLPSLEEGFGLPAAEAMACGTAVIASNIAALREVTAGAAIMIDPTSQTSIADAMLLVANDSDVRDRMIAASRRHASMMTWKRSAGITLDVYRSFSAPDS